MQVNRVSSSRPERVHPHDSVFEAVEKMKYYRLGFLPVVADDGKAVGVVTDRDIAIGVIAEGLDAHKTTVETVMSYPAHWIYEDAEIVDAAHLMGRLGVRRLIVCDHHGKLTGVLSLDDIALYAPSGQTAQHVLEAVARATVKNARLAEAGNL